MKDIIKFRLIGIVLIPIVCAVFGTAVMLLWNALMPQIFGLMPLSYLQAVGLLILARLFFGYTGGGWRGHAHPFHHHKLREKWLNKWLESVKETCNEQ